MGTPAAWRIGHRLSRPISTWTPAWSGSSGASDAKGSPGSLVLGIAGQDVAMLVLEQDDTLVASDRELLYRATGEAGCAELRYEHQRAATEQPLALPYAIAWCWAKGGDWSRRIEPVITDVRRA